MCNKQEIVVICGFVSLYRCVGRCDALCVVIILISLPQGAKHSPPANVVATLLSEQFIIEHIQGRENVFLYHERIYVNANSIGTLSDNFGSNDCALCVW